MYSFLIFIAQHLINLWPSDIEVHINGFCKFFHTHFLHYCLLVIVYCTLLNM